MSNTRVMVGMFAFGGAAMLCAQQPIAVEASLKVAGRGSPVQPVAEQVKLAQQAPKQLQAQPDCTDPWFGVQKIAGREIVLVVGKSKAEAELPDVLFVDRDGDGKLAASERLELQVTSQPGRGDNAQPVQRSQPVEFQCVAGDKKITASFTYLRAGDAAPRATLQFPNYLEATVPLGGEDRLVVVLDQDLDGRFGSAGDLWALTKAGERPVSAYALSAIGERRFENGQRIGIALAKDTTVQVSTAAADGPDPKDAAAHRTRVEHIWSARFDQEREEFTKARGLDTARPLAKSPIPWHYVTFAEALELGRKAGKPVFVDVMAFWCVWCYRMDYYTYPDAEVATMLAEKFVPVKIVQEQDRAGDYDAVMKGKLEARGIPAMGIFDADGNVLHKIGGWKKPQDFLVDLQTGLDAAGKGAAK